MKRFFKVLGVIFVVALIGGVLVLIFSDDARNGLSNWIDSLQGQTETVTNPEEEDDFILTATQYVIEVSQTAAVPATVVKSTTEPTTTASVEPSEIPSAIPSETPTPTQTLTMTPTLTPSATLTLTPTYTPSATLTATLSAAECFAPTDVTLESVETNNSTTLLKDNRVHLEVISEKGFIITIPGIGGSWWGLGIRCNIGGVPITPSPTVDFVGTGVAEALNATASATIGLGNLQTALTALVPSATATKTPTATKTATATPSATKTPTATKTATATQTATSVASATKTPTATKTPSKTALPTSTSTSTLAATLTPTKTATVTMTLVPGTTCVVKPSTVARFQLDDGRFFDAGPGQLSSDLKVIGSSETQFRVTGERTGGDTVFEAWVDVTSLDCESVNIPRTTVTMTLVPSSTIRAGTCEIKPGTVARFQLDDGRFFDAAPNQISGELIVKDFDLTTVVLSGTRNDGTTFKAVVTLEHVVCGRMIKKPRPTATATVQLQPGECIVLKQVEVTAAFSSMNPSLQLEPGTTVYLENASSDGYQFYWGGYLGGGDFTEVMCNTDGLATSTPPRSTPTPEVQATTTRGG